MCRTYVTRGFVMNWRLVSMPSAGLGGLGARGGVRVWTSGGGALHASTGSTFISLPESSSSSSSLSSGKRRCRKRATTKPMA